VGAASASVIALLLVLDAQTSDGVAIVLPRELDAWASDASRFFNAQLPEGGRLRTSTLTDDLYAVSREARRWPEHFVAVFDPTKHRVAVLRPKDGTILARDLSDDPSELSPYAVATVALELLELAREARRGTVVINEAPKAESSLAFRLAIDLSLDLSAIPGDAGFTLARPAIAIGIELRPRSPWSLAFALRAAAFNSASVPSGDYEFAFRRTDLALRVIGSYSEGPAQIGISADGGLSWSSQSAFDANGLEGGALSQLRPWGGASLHLIYELAAGFAAHLETGLSGTPPRTYVIEEQTFSESGLRLHGGLGIIWRSGD
jgi:hypothetical protein